MNITFEITQKDILFSFEHKIKINKEDFSVDKTAIVFVRHLKRISTKWNNKYFNIKKHFDVTVLVDGVKLNEADQVQFLEEASKLLTSMIKR